MNDENPLPLITPSETGAVPVFNCHVILSPPDDAGRIAGRAANLQGIVADGATERDVLTAIMKKFRAAVQEYSDNNQSVPLKDPPDEAQVGEVERFIPVHL